MSELRVSRGADTQPKAASSDIPLVLDGSRGFGTGDVVMQKKVRKNTFHLKKGRHSVNEGFKRLFTEENRWTLVASFVKTQEIFQNIKTLRGGKMFYAGVFYVFCFLTVQI